MFKLSKFTIITPAASIGFHGCYLAFNTLTHRMQLIRESVMNELKKPITSDCCESSPYANEFSRMIESGILVRRNQDEDAEYNLIIDRERYCPKCTYPLVTTTMACNLRCCYCFEYGTSRTVMTKETCDGIIDWMEARLLEADVLNIKPTLFGGEPLLFLDIATYFLDRYTELAQKYGLEHSVSCCTNGVLLDVPTAKELARRGLTHVQFSIDGPPHIHDVRRPMADGRGSFDLAFKNLIDVCDILKVYIKIVLDRQNLPHIAQLMDMIVQNEISQKVTLVIEAVTSTYASIADDNHHCNQYAYDSNSEELADAFIEIQQQATARGLIIKNNPGRMTPCILCTDNACVFDPEGYIYKCTSLIGREEFRVGHVSDKKYSFRYAEQMDVLRKLRAICQQEQCPYVPVCAGGCAYEAYLAMGDYRERYCRRKFLDCYIPMFYLKLFDLSLRSPSLNIREVNAAHQTI